MILRRRGGQDESLKVEVILREETQISRGCVSATAPARSVRWGKLGNTPRVIREPDHVVLVVVNVAHDARRSGHDEQKLVRELQGGYWPLRQHGNPNPERRSPARALHKVFGLISAVCGKDVLNCNS